MSNIPLIVHRNRTNIVSVSLGFDVSQDTLTSEIRAKVDLSSPLIAEWDVAFDTDGTDGELVLTLDDSALTDIQRTYGFMDIKRVTGGEPLSVFNTPLKVEFEGVVTA